MTAERATKPNETKVEDDLGKDGMGRIWNRPYCPHYELKKKNWDLWHSPMMVAFLLSIMLFSKIHSCAWAKQRWYINCMTSGARSTPAGCGKVSFRCWKDRKYITFMAPTHTKYINSRHREKKTIKNGLNSVCIMKMLHKIKVKTQQINSNTLSYYLETEFALPQCNVTSRAALLLPCQILGP